MRADVILDMTGKAGSRISVIDRFYEELEYRLVDLAYADTVIRDHRPEWPMALPANPLPEPDLSDAVRHEVIFNGGMMGRSEEHTSELQSLMRISYAVFCLTKKT